MIWFRFALLPALLAGGAVLLWAGQADAQKGGSASPGARSSSARTSGFSPGGFSGLGFGPGYYGLGYGSLSYGGMSLGQAGPGHGIYRGTFYGGALYPYSPGVSFGIGSSSYDSYSPPLPSSAYPILPQRSAPVAALPANRSATIEVRLPVADAEVTLNEAKTSSTGLRRTYTTPPLEAGFGYSYTVVATWTQGGQPVRVERTVAIAPGQTSLVDFTTVDTLPRMPDVQN